MSNQIVPQAGSTQVEMRNGVPVITDAVLGKYLGFSQPTMVRRLIERHEKTLNEISVLDTRHKPAGSAGGRPSIEYLLTEDHAIYLVTVSGAPGAVAARSSIIAGFAEWRRRGAGADHELAGQVRRIDGIARMLSHKVTEIEKAIGDLVAGQRLLIEAAEKQELAQSSKPAAPEMLAAAEVVAGLCEVPKEKRFGGLAGQVSARLSKYCARNGHLVGVIDLRPGEKLAFPRAAVVAWLEAGGRREIWSLVQSHMVKAVGQGALKLVTR